MALAFPGQLGAIAEITATAGAPPLLVSRKRPAGPTPTTTSTTGNTGHVNGVSWRKCAPEMFIEIDIAGYKHTCLLDTGCDYSLIPQCLVPIATLTLVALDI